MSHVHVVDHPLVKHHLGQLRDERTQPAEFRQLIGRLATLLAYEATKTLRMEATTVQTPLTTAACHRLNERIGLVPILRAGLGMVDPILNLIPTAEVWHLGLYRDEKTALPVEYYSKLKGHAAVDVGLVLDPMLATGGSAGLALGELKNWGVPKLKLLSVIAAQHGIDTVSAQHPEAEIYVCAIDPVLNDRKFIVPGLGDAGDRTFNTPTG